MPRKLLPQIEHKLQIVGQQIKMARLRRRLPLELVAERAGVSRASVYGVERGLCSIAIGIYAAVLSALNGLDDDLLLLAKDDVLGRQLQDMGLLTPKRAPRQKKETRE